MPTSKKRSNATVDAVARAHYADVCPFEPSSLGGFDGLNGPAQDAYRRRARVMIAAYREADGELPELRGILRALRVLIDKELDHTFDNVRRDIDKVLEEETWAVG